MNKKLSLNIITSLTLQIVALVVGLVIPRLILSTFGSEVNGLVSSINQILSYVNLLEGGVASVMMANLYKPLYDADNYQLSRVIKTMFSFFRKLGLIFILYQIVVAFVYPLIVHTNFNYAYVFSLVIILGINTFIQYVFSFSYKLLLNADNKLYLTNIVQIVLTLLNAILVYIGLKIYPNIHFIKLITASVFLLQPVCYYYFVKTNYDIDKNVSTDSNLIAQRWDGFGINLAAFIHNNTDVVILTAFSNLKTVSIYSVYLLVINGVKSLLVSILTSFTPIIGKYIAKNDLKELTDYFEYYEFISLSLVYGAFTICLLLIVPFVMLYTKNLTDANYYQPTFAIVIILAEMVYCLREPYQNIAYQANHFRQTRKYAYIEAILNIVLSIIFVSKFGLIGVALGTLFSMIYRTYFQVVYLEKNILYRSRKIFFYYIITFSLIPLVSYLLFEKFILVQNFNFIILVLLALIITTIIYLIITIIFHRKIFKKFLITLKRK